MGKHVIPFPSVSGLLGINNNSATARVSYNGFSARETAGAEAVVRLRAGGATGTAFDHISLAPQESARESYPDPIYIEGDIYFEIVSGTMEGGIRYG